MLQIRVMKNMRTINLITTGGTIEKSYDELDGTLENRASIIKNRIIDRLRLPHTHINFHPLFAKDSLHMTNEDRMVLANFINSLLPLKNAIVVLHGTDTMVESIKFCREVIKEPTIPIIFTGAMRPIGFEKSDAKQNVTEAIFASSILKAGIYLSFHGSIFSDPNIVKNREKRTFEIIKQSGGNV